jgi:hypothetical protein
MDLYPSSSLNAGLITDLPQTVGMNGARAYPTRASSRTAVFDKDDDVFYVIATDLNNNKTIVRYRFFEEPEPKPEDLFASKSEIKELKGEIDNVQQSIRDLTAAITNAINAAGQSDIQSESGSTNNNKKFVPKFKGESKPNGTPTNSTGQ